LAARDRSDPLARCRDAFTLPDGVIYLDGDSLGPLPRTVAPRLERLIRDEWGRDLIRSWNAHGWIGLAARAAAKIAPLIGAAPEQVMVADSDLDAVRAKSVALTDAVIALVDRECGWFDLAMITPREPSACGSQVSLCHPDGYAIVQTLIACGGIGDFRAPDIIRFGFAPLFLRYVDVWDAVAALKGVLERDIWREPRFQVRAGVT